MDLFRSKTTNNNIENDLNIENLQKELNVS